MCAVYFFPFLRQKKKFTTIGFISFIFAEREKLREKRERNQNNWALFGKEKKKLEDEKWLNDSGYQKISRKRNETKRIVASFVIFVAAPFAKERKLIC